MNTEYQSMERPASDEEIKAEQRKHGMPERTITLIRESEPIREMVKKLAESEHFDIDKDAIIFIVSSNIGKNEKFGMIHSSMFVTGDDGAMKQTFIRMLKDSPGMLCTISDALDKVEEDLHREMQENPFALIAEALNKIAKEHERKNKKHESRNHKG